MKTLSKMKMDCKKGTYFTMMLPTTGNKEEFCQKTTKFGLTCMSNLGVAESNDLEKQLTYQTFGKG